MTEVLSPVAGRVVPLSEAPDAVFAAEMVGSGVAVEPDPMPAAAVSPIAGTLVKLHPHAFVVLAVLPEGGAGVLVHLGIDTVQLKGEGFTLYVDEGAEVEAGQKIVSWDPGQIEAGGRSPVCPVVALDAKGEVLSDLAEPGPVEAGAPLFTWSV